MNLKDVTINCFGLDFVKDKSIEEQRNITLEDLLGICNDLYYENQRLEKKNKSLEQNIEDNYIKRPMSDYTGCCEDDRY